MRTPDVRAETFRRELDTLSSEYRHRLPEKLAALDRLWLGVVSGKLPPAALAELRRELHTLAGSAKTFGAAAVSAAAAAAEAFLDPFCELGTLPGAEDAAQFARLLEALRPPEQA
jgi:HPt (histidine-containing phosphotransfer) domain-containing protein